MGLSKKIKLCEIIDSVQAVRVLQTKELPYKTGYQVNALMKEITKQIEYFEDERKKLNEKFANKDKEGKPIIITEKIGDKESSTYDIPEDNMKEWQDKYKELCDVEIELEFIPIKLSDDIKIAPVVLEIIEKYLEV